MDSGNTDNFVNLDYILAGGSGGFGDMVLFVPDDDLFAGNQYVYLFSQFGCLVCGGAKFASKAGYEEWWVKGSSTDTTVPEPGTLGLLGIGLLATRLRRHNRS